MYGGIQKKPHEQILEKISEYDIFRYYIGEFVLNRSFCSPIRQDKNPSFVIWYSSGTKYKLFFKDYSTGDKGTCFDYISLKYGLSFYDSLKKVSKDFGLNVFHEGVKLFNLESSPFVSKTIDYEKIKQDTIIQCKIRQWNSTYDKEYWSKFGIQCKTLIKYQVFPLDLVFLNHRIIITGTKNNPVYGYYNDLNKEYIEQWKIYKPLEPSKADKWLNNCPNAVIQGYKQLPEQGDYLVLTKALKDVLCLYEMDIPAVAPQSEGILIGKRKMSELKERFKEIYVMFDEDKVGIKGSQKYEQEYSTKSIFIPKGSKCKDIAEYCNKDGLQIGKEMIIKLLDENII